MATRAGRLPNMCVFCAVRASQASRVPARALPRLAPSLCTPARQFSMTPIAARAITKAGKKFKEKITAKREAMRRGVPGTLRPSFNSREEEEEVVQEIVYPDGRGADAGSRAYYHELPYGRPKGNVSTDEYWKVIHSSLQESYARQKRTYCKPGEMGVEEFNKKWRQWRLNLIATLTLGGNFSASGDFSGPNFERWMDEYTKTGKSATLDRLSMDFARSTGLKEPSKDQNRTESLASTVDIRFPQEWYTGTRQMQRTWHLHVGPTNSGKTYHALKRLEETRNGIYAGPLRLLAYEIFEKMNNKGIATNLVTGDDVRVIDPLASVQSSTMEMVDFRRLWDVCVIDEIQMIGDEERGWAWTQALLGVRAKEVHLCGEVRTTEIIKKLAASCGDKLIIHNYNRLGPLEVLPYSIDNDVSKIEKGDCIVTFSRRNIFAMKQAIESGTGKRCAVIYGGLPPETRSLQAQLFNDPNSEYDILVASDAVGMGLNLSVKRIIFEAMAKWNGRETVAIKVPQIKQIAGRAGRYKVALPQDDKTGVPAKDGAIAAVAPLPPAKSVGYVTTFDKRDLNVLMKSMNTEPMQIQKARILPLVDHISRFAAQLPPTTKFSDVLKKLREYLKASTIFTPARMNEQIEAAQLFDNIKNLTVAERMTFVMAPIGRGPPGKAAAKIMAEVVANNADGSILALEGFDLEVLDGQARPADLERLESLHKNLICWLWLSYRFPTTFHPIETTQLLKGLCEEKIAHCLSLIRPQRNRRRREVTVEETMEQEEDQKQEEQKQEEEEDIEELLQVDETDASAHSDEVPREMVTCFVCGELGHLAKDCPETAHLGSPVDPEQGSSRSSRIEA